MAKTASSAWPGLAWLDLAWLGLASRYATAYKPTPFAAILETDELVFGFDFRLGLEGTLARCKDGLN
ncbi:hypothetical protein K0M31_008795 [Melipona bicolor]|uniref:Uncharacterized protein n=1 Tax=Melipona bicolor TaxID=60889 RepID=A0AA40FPU5_9HYME|nr:hypothetical protein K0M31_008795 [Melipona bicolor]